MRAFFAVSGCAAVLAAAGVTGCSSHGSDTMTGTGGATSTTTSTMSTGGEGTGGGPFTPGPHGAAPQVVNLGGKAIASPKVQLIAWASDPVAADADKMITELTTTDTWAEQTMEYGVGAFTKIPSVMRTDTPPAMYDDNEDQNSPLQQELAMHTTGASPDWAPADGSTIYIYLLPKGTDVSSAGVCCTDFLGYHWEAVAGSAHIPYGVVCDCPAAKGDPLTPLQYVTTTIIHEMVEAATDPFVYSDPAWAQTDDADFVWSIATGGEISDMCEYADDANVTPPGATYMIQRSWSNAAAKAGKNPCVPAPGEPYFNAAPVLSDMVTLDWGGSLKTKGVKIAVGQTGVVPVQLWSDTETSGPWKVEAFDLDEWLGYQPHLKVSLDKSSGSNGDTLNLTIQVLSKNTDYGGESFVLVSSLGGQSNLTMGVVGN